jgi:O-antigen ligase
MSNITKKTELSKVSILVSISIVYLIISYYIFTLYGNINFIICILAFSFAFVLFIFSIFDLEVSLLIFILLTPLVESSKIILKTQDFHFNYFLFLGFSMGAVINFIKNKNNLEFSYRFYKPVFMAIVISFISFLSVILKNKILPYFEYGISKFPVNVLGFTNFRSIYFSESYFLLFSTGFLLFFIITRLKLSDKFFMYFPYAVAAGFIITFIIGFYQAKVNINFGNYPNYAAASRINSTLNDPNTFSNYLCLVFPLFIGFGYYFYSYKKYFSILYFVLGVLVLVILPYTGSRAGFIGIMLVTLFYMFYLRNVLTLKIIRKTNKSKLLINCISYLILLIILFVVVFGAFIAVVKIGISEESPSGFKRIARNIDYFVRGYNRITIYNNRDKLWKQAINMFLDRPITGVGIGLYLFELPNYNLKFYGNPRIVFDNPLNLYLEILSEMGIFQLAIYIWFLVEIILFFKNTYIKLVNNKFKFLILNIFLSFSVMLIIYIFSGVTSSFAVRYIFFILVGILVNFRINFNNNNLSIGNLR